MHQDLSNKKILLALTGGIAAYKAAEICRQLRKNGAEVRVVMTAGAIEFITPLTMQALSGNEVHCDLLDPKAEAGMGHIELAKWPDVLVVAPATANLIASYCAGLANDLLTTILMATDVPVFIAPAMNQAMWRHPVTQKNLAQLKTLMGDNLSVLGPDDGEQACGDVGPGRLLEPELILSALSAYFKQTETRQSAGGLEGKKVILTAGPTREAIDPVRYISNHSSGKMGYALAVACKEMGADVTIVSGPCHLAEPKGINIIFVESAAQMYAAVHEQIDKACDIFIACAAVADYRPVSISSQKIKKTESEPSHITLALEQNPDILASVSARDNKPFTVGFAAETVNVINYAKDKLKRKKLDLIVANDVSKEGQGFNSEFNEVCLISQDDELMLPLATKNSLAVSIAGYIAERYLRK